MKIVKKLISIFLIVFVVIGLTQSHINNEKIKETNEEYEIYYTEEAEISVLLKGGKGSLSEGSKYQYDDYSTQFQAVNDVYHEIAQNENVETMNISYYLQTGGIENIVSETYYNFYNHKLIQGRDFSETELENGEYVAIVSSWYAENNNENIVQVGDEIEITQNNDNKFNTIKVKVIGIFENTNTWQGKDFVDAYIFMPTNAMKQISNNWMNNFKDNPNYLEYFLPMGILNPTLTFKNEKEYDSFINYVNEIRENISFDFNYIRLDNHKLPATKFSTSVYELNLKNSIIFSFVNFVLFLMFEIISIYKKNKIQRKFEKQLLDEQERNVQNILMINQDSHKLKHDLKHFLSHVTNLLEKKDVENAIQLLHEYYQEIESLDIPAFTHNRTIDLVINTYKSKANKQNINFTYSSTLIQSLPIIDRKLYILLSNALDNAFTHCDENKKIELSINNIGSYYRFIITNTTKEEKVKKNIIPSNEHGFGTISMIQIIKEIGGEITNEIIDGNYICTILIPIKNNDFE